MVAASRLPTFVRALAISLFSMVAGVVARTRGPQRKVALCRLALTAFYANADDFQRLCSSACCLEFASAEPATLALAICSDTVAALTHLVVTDKLDVRS